MEGVSSQLLLLNCEDEHAAASYLNISLAKFIIPDLNIIPSVVLLARPTMLLKAESLVATKPRPDYFLVQNSYMGLATTKRFCSCSFEHCNCL
jgi:hypothetical protein